MGELSPLHWAVVAVLFVVLFGYRKLPDASRSIGRSLRIFKAEMSAVRDEPAAGAVPAEPAPTAVPMTTAQTSVVEPIAAVGPIAPVAPAVPLEAPAPVAPAAPVERSVLPEPEPTAD